MDQPFFCPIKRHRSLYEILRSLTSIYYTKSSTLTSFCYLIVFSKCGVTRCRILWLNPGKWLKIVHIQPARHMAKYPISGTAVLGKMTYTKDGILFTLPNSSTLRIGTVHLPDRSIPLEWRRVLYYKNPARILSCREPSCHVPGPFQIVLFPSPHKP